MEKLKLAEKISNCPNCEIKFDEKTFEVKTELCRKHKEKVMDLYEQLLCESL